ncbi:DUF6338 family protein [Rhodococcus sp. NPDC057014]|uniref:DUF6338 family protein n=1 Tax=Rhodococcus sp. NPDC057014 TaxID=3346000 RepID=UPI003634879D
MTIPGTLFQLIAFLLLVVPGIVYTACRRYLRGPTPDEKDFSVRLVHAIAASIIFDCVYLIIVGPWIISTVERVEADSNILLTNPRLTALAVLVLAVVIPATVAGIQQVRFARDPVSVGFAPSRRPYPSAWDAKATERADCFVRIRTADGRWVGGYMPSEEGYIATYPESRDIFIPEQWEMGENGEFLDPVKGSLGIYVPLTGNERISWIREPPTPEEQPSEGADRNRYLRLFGLALTSAAAGAIAGRWRWRSRH